MHIPDGFIDAPISITAGVVAVAGLACCTKRASAELDDRLAPLAGLVAAFVFAVQMLNFPVAMGTSGHLLGGALAAILVGPAAGAMCISVVLLVQSLFADGGLTALGLNVTNMALVTAFVGYGLFVMLRPMFTRVLSSRNQGLAVAGGLAAGISVPVAALAFSLEFATGGVADLPVSSVVWAMVGTHVLVGIGEGIITYLTLSAVLKIRPDLVYGARPAAVDLREQVAA